MAVALAGVLTLAGFSWAVSGVLAQLVSGGGPSTAVTYIVSALVALGALIFIHELGHFLVAKASGVGVERFSLGFGPRLWSMRRGETEYCISIVPLGGYVKMVGEEAHGEEAIHPATDVPREVRTDPRKSFALKPLWVRALIVFAGPGMNFVLAAVIFSFIFAAVGVPVFPTTVGRVLPESAAAQAGLQPGDDILAVDDRPVRHWGQIEERVARSEGRPLALTVSRDGVRRAMTVTPRRVPARTPFGEPTEVWSLGTGPYFPPVVGEVQPGMPAAEAGLQPRDRIVALDGRPVGTWDELAETISKMPGRPVALTIERSGQRLETSVTPRAVTERDPLGNETQVGRIGIARASSQTFLRSDPITALGQGIQRTWDVTALTVVSIWKLVTGTIPASNIGGPLQISMAAGQQAQQGLVAYAFFVALISVNLAILNLLPVPMLDGGHLLFFAIEGVQGRPLSVRKRELAQQIGLALLMLLMVFALFNDLSRLLPVSKLFK
ncbi:MAG TPA: RIP metalloprotease RseP [Methylomirabilota bacterium]|nr:RIP metalloprotease RseP [Methylomirabilota bacterium]